MYHYDYLAGVLWAFPIALILLIGLFLSLIFKDSEPIISDFDKSFNVCIEQGGVPVISQGFFYKNIDCNFK